MTYYIVFRELKISNSNYFLKTIEGKFTEKSSHSREIIFITGGAGSIGFELLKQIAKFTLKKLLI